MDISGFREGEWNINDMESHNKNNVATGIAQVYSEIAFP